MKIILTPGSGIFCEIGSVRKDKSEYISVTRRRLVRNVRSPLCWLRWRWVNMLNISLVCHIPMREQQPRPKESLLLQASMEVTMTRPRNPQIYSTLRKPDSSGGEHGSTSAVEPHAQKILTPAHGIHLALLNHGRR